MNPETEVRLPPERVPRAGWPGESGSSIQKAATLDHDENDRRPALRLCRRATGLAIGRLRAEPGDSEALHAAARAELVRERPEQAARLAKRAILVSATPPAQPLVTLARAYHRMGRLRSAQRAANLALEAAVPPSVLRYWWGCCARIRS